METRNLMPLPLAPLRWGEKNRPEEKPYSSSPYLVFFRASMVSILVLCFAVLGTAHTAQSPAATAPIVAVGGPYAATNLEAKVDCSVEEPRKGIAHLSWTVALNTGSEQRVEVTIFRDGFETGAFERSGPLPPNQSTLTWKELKGQAIHHWRVLTRISSGWVATETASFEGSTCVANFVPGM